MIKQRNIGTVPDKIYPNRYSDTVWVNLTNIVQNQASIMQLKKIKARHIKKNMEVRRVIAHLVNDDFISDPERSKYAMERLQYVGTEILARLVTLQVLSKVSTPNPAHTYYITCKRD